MTAKELRAKFLEFFKEKGHSIIPSASLIPENDPTVLFTTAGMHPLVPYLMGEKHPGGKRLADAQKCIRTGDIEEVGDVTHHTFFEMLGNWSLGDYFKREAIEWSYEFLTSPKWLGLPKERIAVSVFAGDADAPYDDEAFQIWRSLGISEKRIAKLPKKNNWWGPAGETGPCGPDTEIFFWAGDSKKTPESFNDDHPSWVEIWNNVFMQYGKTTDGKYELLAQKNVDTGMGLERTLSAINGLSDNYKTELFAPIIKKIEGLSGLKYEEKTKEMRIIADHLKAATFILGDDRGIVPGNAGAGYVIRRLIRRAVRYGKAIGISKKSWTKEIAMVVADNFADEYPELQKNIDFILNELSLEEEKFEKTLEKGLKEFEKVSKDGKISGKEAFILFSTYGFPMEMVKEIADEKKISVDCAEFEIEFAKHQELSRTSSAGMFKGGLADAGEQTRKLHTATHMLLSALRKTLGEHVFQRGSNITPERLRFDFSYAQKMTAEEIKKVEDIVNEKIGESLPVICEEMEHELAKSRGVMGVFEHKYGDKVKVYTIGDSCKGTFSAEMCGGPHVCNTSELGHFKIIKEEAVSAGIRRIKAILE